MPIPALELEAVGRQYRTGRVETTALADVSVAIAPGSVVAVTGASGSGKSTLLHLAAGLIAPTTGRVLVAGTDVGTLSATGSADLRRTEVGIVFQQYNLVPSLTAVENVMLPLELSGLGRRDARRTARAALERVGIERPFDRYPDDLSGGQQQRVAIARAVATPRTLVLADEPTGALDTATGDQVMNLLVQRARAGAAVVVVTHEPRVAAFAERVLTLRDGRLVADTGGPAAVPSGPPAMVQAPPPAVPR